jgi:HAD superfamily hydrolase (TIGR01509 family)
MTLEIERALRDAESAVHHTPALVIFDCDGVLVDSEMLSCGIDAELLAERGVTMSTEEVLNGYAGMSYASMIAEISRERGVDLGEDFEREALERFGRAIETQLAPIPGIAGVLERLELPVCVASSSALSRVVQSLEVTGLIEHFAERIFSAEMVEAGKPAPDLFLFAARACGVAPPACLVVEDSPHGITAALAAGMRAVGFTAGAHCDAGREAAIVDAGAHLLARDDRELEKILRASCQVRNQHHT